MSVDFPAPFSADEPVNAAFGYPEADILQRLHPDELLFDASHFEDRLTASQPLDMKAAANVEHIAGGKRDAPSGKRRNAARDILRFSQRLMAEMPCSI